MSFQDLSLAEPLLRALQAAGYHTPTPIQQEAIPVALSGADLLACAQTGTGKTAAFCLPIIQQLLEVGRGQGPVAPRALILSPTRELASQIAQSLQTYSAHTPLKHTVIFGGVAQRPQTDALRRGVDVVIATPGRLLDLSRQRQLDLRQIQFLVLDEADRMLEMGFIDDIRRIVSLLPTYRQTLFFSATMPREIERLAGDILHEPVQIRTTPVENTAPSIDQAVYFVNHMNKQALLLHLLEEDTIDRALVFTRTKHGADAVADALSRAGIQAEAFHGNKSQGARQTALRRFKDRRTRVLVATDIAARGIDVDALSHVVNYEMPDTPETYIHRIGRTGRAGAVGTALSFCDMKERHTLQQVMRHTGQNIPVLADHPYAPTEAETNVRFTRYEGRARNGRGGSRPRPRRSF